MICLQGVWLFHHNQTDWIGVWITDVADRVLAESREGRDIVNRVDLIKFQGGNAGSEIVEPVGVRVKGDAGQLCLDGKSRYNRKLGRLPTRGKLQRSGLYSAARG